jgi:hypothetical protein
MTTYTVCALCGRVILPDQPIHVCPSEWRHSSSIPHCGGYARSVEKSLNTNIGSLNTGRRRNESCRCKRGVHQKSSQ